MPGSWEAIQCSGGLSINNALPDAEDEKEAAAIRAERDKLSAALTKFLSVAMTCKKRNEPGWMSYFAEQINVALEALGIEGRVRWPGIWSNEFHLESGGGEEAEDRSDG